MTTLPDKIPMMWEKWITMELGLPPVMSANWLP